MPKSLLLLLFFVVFKLPAQDINRVRQTIKTLCAPEMHGGGYTQNGDKLAANFIQKEFRQVGLKLFSDSYLQQFLLPVNTISDVELKFGHQKLKPGTDFI